MSASIGSCRGLASAVLGIVLLASNSSWAALIGHWTFDTNLANSGTTGATDNATVLNGTPVAGSTVGIAGNGLRLVKSESDSIRLPVSSTDLTSTFTISVWYNQDTGVASTRHFVFEGSNNFNISYGTGSSGFGATQYSSYVGGTIGPTTAATSLDTWHHVLQSFTTSGANTTMTVYVDGGLLGTQSAPTANVTLTAINVGNARDGQARYFDGILDDIATWTDPLNVAESRAVYTLMTSALNYNAGYAEELFALHTLGSGSDVVNGKTWFYTTGLTGNVGDVVSLGGGDYALRLSASGSGVITVVPEPSSLAMLAFGAITLWFFRKK